MISHARNWRMLCRHIRRRVCGLGPCRGRHPLHVSHRTARRRCARISTSGGRDRADGRRELGGAAWVGGARPAQPRPTTSTCRRRRLGDDWPRTMDHTRRGWASSCCVRDVCVSALPLRPPTAARRRPSNLTDCLVTTPAATESTGVFRNVTKAVYISDVHFQRCLLVPPTCALCNWWFKH